MRNILLVLTLFAQCFVYGQNETEKIIAKENNLPKKAKLISKYLERLIYSDTLKYLQYTEELNTIYRKTGNIKYKRDYYDRIGRHHYFAYRFEKAISYFDSSFQINKKLKDTLGLISSHVNFGGVHYMLRHFDVSLDHYLHAATYNEFYKHDNKQKFSIKGNIGMVYREIGQPELSKKYFTESLKENEADKDTISVIKALNNLGLIAKDLKQFNDADFAYTRAIELAEAVNSVRDLSDIYFNYGNLKLQLKKYSLGLLYLKKSEESSLKIGDESGVAETYLLMSECCEKLGQNGEALNYLNKAMKIADKFDNHKSQMDAHAALFNFYKTRNDYKKALEHLIESLHLKETVDKEENMEGAMLLKTEYEQTQKRLLDSLNHINEKKIQEAQTQAALEKQRNFTTFFVVAGVLCLGIALLSFFAYQHKKKSEKEINLQKTELEVKNKEIVSSIEYALRIQNSQLPTESYILKNLLRLKN
jgi:tetratricopeptide (TPR) repeat protein